MQPFWVVKPRGTTEQRAQEALSGQSFAAKKDIRFPQGFGFPNLQVGLAEVGGLCGIRARLQVSLLDEIAPAFVTIG